MGIRAWWWTAAGLVLAAVVSVGCNPITSLFFLLPHDEPKMKADFPLASTDKNEKIRVVVVADYVGQMRHEFDRVEHDLTDRFVRKLQEGCKVNKEEVELVPAFKVAKFKDEHSNWRTYGPQDISKHFDTVDYVVNLEITQLSFYERGSRNDLYRGRAEISVSVVDVTRPEEDAVFTNEYTVTYPEGRPVPVDNSNLKQFKQDFLNRVATDLSWLFTPHLVADHHHCD